MAVPPFALNWDYRCPFARVLHEHVLCGLEAGAPWQVRFLAFSLDQSHVAEGDPPVWDQPAHQGALLSLRVGVAVREHFPHQFRAVHGAIFRARQTGRLRINSVDDLGTLLAEHDLPAGKVIDRALDPVTVELIRAEHELAVERFGAFGTPVLITGGSAAFVRYMRGPGGDPEVAIRTVERLVGMLAEWPELNEFKHTRSER